MLDGSIASIRFAAVKFRSSHLPAGKPPRQTQALLTAAQGDSFAPSFTQAVSAHLINMTASAHHHRPTLKQVRRIGVCN